MYLTESYWSYNVKDYILPFHKKLIGTVLLSPVVQDFQNTIRPYVFFIIQKKVKMDGTEMACIKFGCY